MEKFVGSRFFGSLANNCASKASRSKARHQRSGSTWRQLHPPLAGPNHPADLLHRRLNSISSLVSPHIFSRTFTTIDAMEPSTKPSSSEDKKYSASKLRKIAKKMATGIEVKDRSVRLTKYSSSFVASEAVTWLQNHLACPQEKAIQVGQQLCDAGFIKHVTDYDKSFQNENALFRFHKVPTDEELRESVSDEWIAALVNTMDLEQKGNDWVLEKESKDTKAPNFEAKAWSRLVPGEALKAFKVSVRSKAKMDKLVQLLHEQMTERHGEWNATYVRGKVLHKLDDDTNVQWWLYNPGSLLSKRDFVVVRRRVANKDGSVIIVDRAVETGLLPPIDGYVRCDLPYNIRMLVPATDPATGESFTWIHYMNKTDIGGWVPKAVVNSVNADVSMTELKHVVDVCL